MRCITWCGALRGCLAVKFDSYKNLLSSVIILHLRQVENYTQKFVIIIIIIIINIIIIIIFIIIKHNIFIR